MKQCPKCQQLYRDESLNFCLSDGVPLVVSPTISEVETVVPSGWPRKNDGPVITKGVSPLFAYLAIALIALIAGGAFVAWFNAQPNTPEQSIASNSYATPTTEANRIENSTAKEPNSGNNNSVGSLRTEDANQMTTEVKNSLDDWVATLRSKDLDSHMNLYDNKLDTYFRKSNADLSFVRADNLRLFRKYDSFNLEVSNLKIDVQPDADRATTTFDSTFNFQGTKTHSGSVQSEIRWKKVNGVWKITSQRDLRTYRIDK